MKTRKTNDEYRKEAVKYKKQGDECFLTMLEIEEDKEKKEIPSERPPTWDDVIDYYFMANNEINNIKYIHSFDHLSLAQNYFMMKLAHSYQNEKDNADNCEQQAYEELNQFSKKDKPSFIETIDFSHLHEISPYLIKSDPEKAFDLYKFIRKLLKKVRPANLKANDCRKISKISTKLGESYNSSETWEKAVKLFRIADFALVDMGDKRLTNDDHREMGILANLRGIIYNEQEKWEKAINEFYFSVRYLERIAKEDRIPEDYETLTENYKILAEYYYKVSNYKEAAEFFEKLIAIKSQRSENCDESHYRNLEICRTKEKEQSKKKNTILSTQATTNNLKTPSSKPSTHVANSIFATQIIPQIESAQPKPTNMLTQS